MNLYLLTSATEIFPGYDTYDSLVVVAENEEAAKLIHPNTFLASIDNRIWESKTWAKSPDDVIATFIGVAATNLNVSNSIVISSFNAG